MLADHLSEIRLLYQSGRTMQQIGEAFGVSRQRVQQVIGLCRSDGGAKVRGERREANRIAKLDAKYMAKHGCTFAEYKKLLEKHNGISPVARFNRQKTNARIRGIVWELKLWDWWRIWDVSGKWAQRGRGHGYVMARKGDCGPYSVANVYITTSAQNVKDSYIFRPYHMRKHPARKDHVQRSRIDS